MRVLKSILAIIIIAALIAGIFIYIGNRNDSSGSEIRTDSVIINEFMASNGSFLPDEEGKYSDWFEIHNPTDSVIDLSGFGMSNDNKTAKWTFPNIMLQPDGYILVFASGSGTTDTSAVYQHAGFKLNASEGGIYLFNAAGEIADSVEYKNQKSNISAGRDPANMAEWIEFDNPTPGFPNDEAGYAAFRQSRIISDSKLLITEVMPSNATTIADNNGNFSDYIEIYNAGQEAVNLSGYGLSDDSSKVFKWRFPDITVEPDRYLIIWASGEGENATDLSLPALHTGFRVSAYRENIVLSDPMGYILDQIDVSEVPTDNAYARVIASGAYGSEWKQTSLPTPGYANSDEGYSEFESSNKIALGPVVINEVMTANTKFLEEEDGQYYDWIELYNTSDSAVDITGYGLTDDTNNPAKWRFPESTVAPEGYLTVLASGLDNNGVKKKYLNTNFRLKGEGEVLALFDSSGNLQDRYNVRTVPRGVSLGRVSGENSLFLFKQPTPMEENSHPEKGVVSVPEPGIEAGCYQNAQQVSLECSTEGAKIYYTLDGTLPTDGSTLYKSPITINGAGTIRARAYKNEYVESGVCTATYIINGQHTLPVLSIVAEPDDLYSYNSGIFAMGPGASDVFPYSGANFWQDWEVPAHIEIIGDGRICFAQDIGLKVFGAYSRAIEQKGMAVFARSKYGESTINYPLFPDHPYTEYKSFVLRSGGQDGPLTKMRDVLQSGLLKEAGMNVSVMDYKTYVVYINGEYRGVYHMREKINKYYIAQHFGIDDPDSIDLLVGNGTPLVGSNEEYKALIDYMKTHSLADRKSFDYVASLMDVDSYMDYAVAEIYYDNTDLGNIKFWKDSHEGSKWRWIVYDLDWGMYKVTRDSVKAFIDPEGMGVNKAYSTQVFRSLLQNEEWKQRFLKRFSELLSTAFEPQHVLERIDGITAAISGEFGRDRQITGQSAGNYDAHMQRLRYFAENRPEIVVYQLRVNLGLTQQQTRDIFGTIGRAPTQQEIDKWG